MKAYSAGVRTAAATAVTFGFGANFYNPTAETVYITQLSWCKSNASGGPLLIVRSTSTGTGASQSTAQQNDSEYQTAPGVTAIYFATFTVEPVAVSSVAIAEFMFGSGTGTTGQGIIIPFPEGLAVPSGTGIGMCGDASTLLQPADFTVWWRE